MNAPTASRPRHVLLAVTGSFGAWATPALVYCLRSAWKAEVRVVVSPAAERFVTPTTLEVASGHAVCRSADHRGGPDGPAVAHLADAEWADLVLVAPATADVLAHLAHGLADSPLTTTLLAARSDVVVAPSMNERMWTKPAVQRNITRIGADGVGVVPPVTGPAAHDLRTGTGSMPDPLQLLRWLETWWEARHG